MNPLPLFSDAEGRQAADPLHLAGPALEVDLEALALLLSPPALLGEFVPRCVWRGVERLPAEAPEPLPVPLPRAFAHSVETLTADAGVIGVLVSGGLDSLAVLIHTMQAANGQRVVAFTTDLTDDTGASSAAVVRRLLADLKIPAELVVLDPDRDRADAPWSAVGPRLDALPDINAAAALRAAECGADILLSGDGADELLGVPRYATTAVALRHSGRAAVRYAADVAASGPGLPGECAAAMARLLPRGPRARLYWSANWPAWCDPVAPAVLAEPYQSAATAWARRWVRNRIAAHAAAGRSWAEADAHDAVFPREAILPAGPVREASPFLHETFHSAARALPLGDRYHPGLPSAYLRCKAQVVRLLPRHALPMLPRRKQYFAGALTRQAMAGREAPRCVAAGLLDPVALATERDPSVLLVVAALESWLAGAEQAKAALAAA